MILGLTSRIMSRLKIRYRQDKIDAEKAECGELHGISCVTDAP